MNSIDSFMNELKEIDDQTELITSKFKDLYFENMGTLVVNNKKYEISNCAYLTINNQIKIKGAGVREIPNDLLTKVYNVIMKEDRLKDVKANIIITNNAIKGLMIKSEDERSYRYISSYRVLSIIEAEAQKNDMPIELISGTQDDCITVVDYKLNNYINDKYSLGISVKNSTNGYSSIYLILNIVYKNKVFNTTIKEVMEHKGDIEGKIKKGLRNIFSQIRNMDINKKMKEPITDKYIESLGYNKYQLKYIARHFKGTTIGDFMDFCVYVF